jgi:predicted amidohydrolase YtcJ
MPADLIVVNARVFRAFAPGATPLPGSLDGPRPDGAPTAVTIVGGRIAFVGSDAEAIRQGRGPRTEIVDAGGGLLTAGFDDAHSHVLAGARALDQVDLFSLETVDAIAATIRVWADAHPERPWVEGRGWFYVPFPGGLPTRQLLDAIVPDRPAYLEGYDGHTGWANTRALAAAGIDATTPDPRLGEIVRDAGSGEATGALKEAAMRLVVEAAPVPSHAADLASMRRAFAGFLRAGITAVQDAFVEPAEVGLWRELVAAGDLGVRARLALPMRPADSLEAWRARLDEYAALVDDLRGGTWLDAGILKSFADGVIESRTAAMLAPYEGTVEQGVPEWTADALDAHVAEADRRGWQLEIHAIGDGGVRMVLDAYRRASAAYGPRPVANEPRRHRVEHIETIAAVDIARFGREGVVASMQPFHADPSPNQISTWAGNIGPERASRAWPWRSILASGAPVALGSDWPVVPFDPFLALHGAVTRENVHGEPPGGWLPSERLTLPEALSAYGRGSAFAAFAERRRGTVTVGLDADLVVLDRDPLVLDASAIIGTNVALTVVGGKVVHRQEASG